MRVAWFCPGCQKHHAPHVETCPAPADAISATRLPIYPTPGSAGDVPFKWEPVTSAIGITGITMKGSDGMQSWNGAVQ